MDYGDVKKKVWGEIARAEVGEELNQDLETGIYFGEVSREESEKPQELKPTLGDDGLGFYGYDWNNLRPKPKSKDE